MTERLWYIALGSNLADSQASLQLGWQAVCDMLALRDAVLSSVWVTMPAEGARGPQFANAVGRGVTTLQPHEGLQRLQRIERAFGRDRGREGFHGARPLDLDILLIDGVRLTEAELTLPHPRLTERTFVVGPLREICRDFVDDRGRTLDQIAADLCLPASPGPTKWVNPAPMPQSAKRFL